MKPFEIFYPTSTNEAAALLGEYGGEARILGGGTELLVNMKLGLCSPRYLISLKRIPEMKYKVFNGDILKMGSFTLIHDIEYPENQAEDSIHILFEAARSVGSVQIRNQATLGGNICQEPRCIYYNHSKFWRESLNACIRRGGDKCYISPGSKKCVAGYCSDMAPVLLALDSKISMIDTASLKEDIVGFEDFLERRLMNNLSGILKEIQVPMPKGFTKGIYIKYTRRKGIGFALMNAGIFLTFEKDKGQIKDARVVIGGLPDFPKRIREAEDMLKGATLEENLVEDLAGLIPKKIPLFSDPFLSKENKITIMAALLRRGMKALA